MTTKRKYSPIIISDDDSEMSDKRTRSYYQPEPLITVNSSKKKTGRPSKKQKQQQKEEEDDQQQHIIEYTEPLREYKSFSRNQRLLYDQEVDELMELVLGGRIEYYQTTTTTIYEYLQNIKSINAVGVMQPLFQTLIGNGSKYMISILNTYNPTLEQDDENNFLHFVLLILNTSTSSAILFDPLQTDEEGKCQKEIVANLQKTINDKIHEFGVNKKYKIQSNCMDLQHDEWNCSIYCLLALERFLNGQALLGFTVDEKQIKKERTRFAKLLYGH